MVMNNIYYYCCYICSGTTFQGYVGEDLNNELTGALSSTNPPCSNCNYGFPYQHRKAPKPLTNETNLDHVSNSMEFTQSLQQYDNYPFFTRIHTGVVPPDHGRTVTFQDGGMQKRARLFEVQVGDAQGTLPAPPIWCIGQQLADSAGKPPKGEHEGQVQNIASIPGKPNYRRLTVKRNEGAQEIHDYHVLLTQ
jgi:hypothetical protein